MAVTTEPSRVTWSDWVCPDGSNTDPDYIGAEDLIAVAISTGTDGRGLELMLTVAEFGEYHTMIRLHRREGQAWKEVMCKESSSEMEVYNEATDEYEELAMSPADQIIRELMTDPLAYLVREQL